MGLAWAGDGGAYALLIDRQESYDALAQCAMNLLKAVADGDPLKIAPGLAREPVAVRISCHAGQAVFNRDGSLFHGDELNAFVKHEREIGVPNRVVITEAVYRQIVSGALRDAFASMDRPWTFQSASEPRAQKLYIAPKPADRDQPRQKAPARESSARAKPKGGLMTHREVFRF